MTIKNFSAALVLLALALLSPGISQELGKPAVGAKGKSDSLGLSSLAGGKLGGLAEPISFAAKYEVEQSGQRGRLMVTATIEEPYYVFSTTQPKPALPTVIEIESNGITLTGPFVADREPEVTYDTQGLEGVRVEKYRESVTWTAPITFAQQLADKSMTIDVKVDGQVCRKGQCIPIMGKTATAEFAGYYAPAVASEGPYRDPKGHADWAVSLSSNEVKPGSSVTLEVTGTPDGGYHLYPLAAGEESVNQKTVIVVTQTGTLNVGATDTSSPVKHLVLVPGVLETDYHEGAVTWKIPITIDADKPAGSYPISGVVGFQTCKDDQCDQPLAFRFSGEIKVGDVKAAGASVPMAIASVDYSVATKSYAENRNRLAASKPIEAVPRQALAPGALFGYFAMAMLGGFILNFMPCVLPVIGLKVLSFIDESNGNSRRIAALNLWYTAGILSVFMGFAVITIIVQLVWNQTISWGQQFQSFGLQLVIIMLLAAMALSFMGVWEIPVPGFANHGKAAELSMRQGSIGAYNKGLIATLLAIPCSGPMLGPVFALMLSQPAWVVLLMFLGVGLGMASPYIVFAAYPNAMKFLPKPGNWMITFKQFLAFPLLLAVVWFISTVDAEYRIAALTIAVMVGMACWIIGRVPAYAETPEKLRTWIAGAAIVAVSCVLSLRYLGPRDIIKWEPYNEAQLQELVASGRPVFIDFTAQWCSTCQVNSLIAIETHDVAEALRKNNFVPMLADWSKPNPAIAAKVQQLNSNSIPLLAIYPAGDLENPIVLRDSLLEGMVLKGIEKAVAETKIASPKAVAAVETSVSRDKSVATKESVVAKTSVSKVLETDKDPKNLKISKPVLQSVGKETGVR